MFPTSPQEIALTAGMLCVACGVGFVTGVTAAPYWHAVTLWLARRSANRLARIVEGDLQRAEESCRALSDAASDGLHAAYCHRLITARDLVDGALQRVLLTTGGKAVSDRAAVVQGSEQHINWINPVAESPPDDVDPDVVRANVGLLAGSLRAGQTAAIVVISIDHLDRVAQRVGPLEAALLVNKFAAVLTTAQRDCDLTLLLSRDRLVVLMPAVKPIEALRQTQRLRDAVRRQQFFAGTIEILLTGSFGCSVLLAGEDAQLALNRASDAAARSQRRGRNQLHLHDGQRCVATRA